MNFLPHSFLIDNISNNQAKVNASLTLVIDRCIDSVHLIFTLCINNGGSIFILFIFYSDKQRNAPHRGFTLTLIQANMVL